MDGDPPGDLGFIPDQGAQPRLERVGEGLRERGQQHPRPRIPTRQHHRAVKRDDRLAGAGRARDARRAGVVAIDHAALRRVQKDRPFVPRVFEGAFQLLDIGQDTEAALRVGVAERIGLDRRRRWNLRRSAGRQVQQRLARFLRQVIGEVEQGVLGRAAHFTDSFGRHPIGEEHSIRDIGKERRLRHLGRRRGGWAWRGDFFDSFSYLDELRRTGGRMPLDLGYRVVDLRGHSLIPSGHGPGTTKR
jgi:hypothetical protein